MKYYIYIFVAVLTYGRTAVAAELSTGADVLQSCQAAKGFLLGTNDDSRSTEMCISFLRGFDSAHAVFYLTRDQKELYCQPEGNTTGSMAFAVVEGLEKDATFHSAPAGIAVWKALADAWPCDS